MSARRGGRLRRALVAASEAAYLVLKVLGAGVLLWLGVRACRTAWREAAPGRRRGSRHQFVGVRDSAVGGRLPQAATA